ncbi:MAG: biotin--[acetyl-CoA-carboxylase] ligase [Carbonactinosporaceae bacterium]
MSARSTGVDLERPPLREADVLRVIGCAGGASPLPTGGGAQRLWREVRVVAETGSTNADLVEAARAGAPEGVVRAAELQTAGRGRLGRSWTAPPRSALTFSVLLRPRGVPGARWSWAPLLVGVAAATATARVAGLPVDLKWPNDLLVRGRKVAGVLVERVDGALVAGVGLNVSLHADELPTGGATSLLLEGAVSIDRATLLTAVLGDLAQHYGAWRGACGDALRSGLRSAYRARCATIGRVVRVALPGGEELHGEAVDVDAEGRLVVRTARGDRVVGAGEIVHVR